MARFKRVSFSLTEDHDLMLKEIAKQLNTNKSLIIKKLIADEYNKVFGKEYSDFLSKEKHMLDIALEAQKS